MPEKYDVKEELRQEWYIFLCLLVVFLVSLAVYPALPEEVAIHWNIQGNPDGYGSKFTGAFALPLATFVLYLLLLFVPLVDPRRDNYPHFIKAYRLLKLGFVLFMLILHLLTLAFNLGYNIDIGRFVTLCLGLLFTLMGIGLPRITPNYFVGIRTPWTLASGSVWTQTHHFGGKLFFWSGLLVIISIFLPGQPRFWLMMALLFGSSLTTAVYSYLIFRKEENAKKE